MYWPQCSGTPDIKGMKRETPDFGLPIPASQSSSAAICTFTSKEAVQRAALEAEKFLSAPHIVDVNPLSRLRPRENEASADTDATGDDAADAATMHTGRTGKTQRPKRPATDSYSTSSTSTVSPVTRWASAAAIKSSILPSSTSSGVGEVTPVLRSLTIW